MNLPDTCEFTVELSEDGNYFTIYFSAFGRNLCIGTFTNIEDALTALAQLYTTEEAKIANLRQGVPVRSGYVIEVAKSHNYFNVNLKEWKTPYHCGHSDLLIALMESKDHIYPSESYGL